MVVYIIFVVVIFRWIGVVLVIVVFLGMLGFMRLLNLIVYVAPSIVWATVIL